MGAGIGVINKSSIPEINIGLSMQAIHYHENGVKENEIFYRRPGAVWYTVIAFARDPTHENDITMGQVVKEIIAATAKDTSAVVAAGGIVLLTIATKGKILRSAPPLTRAITTINMVRDAAHAASYAYTTAEGIAEAFGNAAARSNLHCERKFNYCGGSGSWLVVEGGPYVGEDGTYQPCDLSIREATQDDLFDNGTFTSESHRKFHSKTDLECTTVCPYC